MRPARAVTNLGGMAQTPKRPRDANQLAKFIVDMATEGEVEPAQPKADAQQRGGLAGGKARAAVLTEKRRAEIATKAAKIRWADKAKKSD